MKLKAFAILFALAASMCGGVITAGAGTISDNFNTSVNYLASGVAGTIWDGVYFGAEEFVNTGVGGGGPGATLQCNANLTAAGRLTLQTTGTAWEGADDDGFFLFKVVKGNFSAIVRVVSPYDNTGFNTAGLQARAFSPGGDPFGGSEDYVSWTRFDQFGFANYLRNEVNGGVQQVNPGGAPNSAYWLRMDRVGNVFRFYQRTNISDAWRSVSFPAPVNGTNLTRSDLAGQPLQVGIIHATFNNQIGVQFTDFSITATNFDSFVAPPAAATGLSMTTNNAGNIVLSWTPGAGSAGSVVVMWAGTNILKQTPANGFSYSGDASYGAGSLLPGAGYSVVYSGSGNSVTVSNLSVSTAYHAAVFAYAGSGNATAYNHSPPMASVSIPANKVMAVASVAVPDVLIGFSANPGKWYTLQYSDSLSAPDWQNLGSEPVLANSAGMVLVHVNGALGARRFYRLLQLDPDFKLKTSFGALTSLKRTGDSFNTEYIAGGRRLGDANLKYRPTGATPWTTARSSPLTGIASVTYSTNSTGDEYKARYVITAGLTGSLIFESVFHFHEDTIDWKLNFTNLASQSIEIGDAALPLPMNTAFSGVTSSVLKHSFISGYGSFLFWMRPNSVGPYLVLTPDDGTKLEYWDVLNGGFETYIHSLAAGGISATNFPGVTTQGDRWRQPHTSLTLAPGAAQSYGFKFQWADDYEGVRQAVVNEGKVDVRVVPGMTVPTNLLARVALRTAQTLNGIDAEFPAQTQIQYVGAGGAGYQLYDVQFSRLGENQLTVRYGNNRSMFLEFFVTEPIETLIKKRSAFLAAKQVNDPGKWYNGLYCDWNMNSQTLITPDNHDTITGFVVYEIASDDAGESRPAYMAEKLAVYPVQNEVSSLDSYIQNFVWGGLQRKTNETFSYGVYGIPDWNQLRTNNTLSIGRGYDYPHIIDMYWGMYRVAKYHPEVTTALSAQEYLRRAYGTTLAMFSYGGFQASSIGLMNEVVIPDVIDALVLEGMTNEAANIRAPWETKVNYYVSGSANLFGSEYAFDSTGFESQQAYGKYALQHAATLGATNVPAFVQQVKNFMATEIDANVFARGWLETTYYYYGSDYRGNAGNDYVLSYMAQMGGWGLLDYSLNNATNATHATDLLQLGYASYLSAWATMNTGTPASNYGFWYPGAANDGGCGGGFEPLPYNTTWLGQPMHRGTWYYSCEENLGFCGAIRMAATILADDPISGRFCYGGDWLQSASIQVYPKDGVRQRFHAMLNSGTLHLQVDTDRFAAAQPITFQSDISVLNFTIETDNPAAHAAKLRLSAPAGSYTVSDSSGTIAILNLAADQESLVDLPVEAATTTKTFTLTR